MILRAALQIAFVILIAFVYRVVVNKDQIPDAARCEDITIIGLLRDVVHKAM